jgi:histidine triad (HIT) family protein
MIVAMNNNLCALYVLIMCTAFLVPVDAGLPESLGGLASQLKELDKAIGASESPSTFGKDVIEDIDTLFREIEKRKNSSFTLKITKEIGRATAKYKFTNEHDSYKKPPEDENKFVNIIKGEAEARMLFADKSNVGIFSLRGPASVSYTKILVIPRKKVENITGLLTKVELQALLKLCDGAANQLKYNDHYVLVTNCGADAAQTVPHLHIHLEAHYKYPLFCPIYDLIKWEVVAKGTIDKGFNIVGKLLKWASTSSCASKKNTSVVEWLEPSL